MNTAPFQVVALSSANLPVTLAVQGPATLSPPRLLTLTGVGTVTVTASQAGNAEYAPVTAQLSFVSTAITPTVSATPFSVPYGTGFAAAQLNAAAQAPAIADPAADQATVTSQLNASALTNASTFSYPAESSVFRYEGDAMGPTRDPNGVGAYGPIGQPAPYGLQFKVDFTCNCKQFEFAALDGHLSYRLWVDGAYTSLDSTNPPNAYPSTDYVLVTFPDKRDRQIKIVLGTDAFFGVNATNGDTLSAPEVPIGPPVMIFGDSWTSPTILPPALPPPQDGLTGSGYPQTLGDYFNWDYWDDGIGGSGFTTPGTDLLGRNFAQRVLTDVCPYKFGGVVLLGGTNDGSQPQSVAQPEVSQTLAELNSCEAGVPVYMYGPQAPSGPETGIEQAMQAAFAAAAGPLTYTDMEQLQWFYGSPTDPSTGNEYLYFNGHPTPLGHDYLAEQIAMDLVTRFPAMLPKPYPLFAPSPVAGTVSASISDGTLLTAGTHPVTVTFVPSDMVNYTDASAIENVVVTQASTSVSLTASQANGLVTLTASVAPQIAGTPTGIVTFLDSGRALGTAALVNGTATAQYGTSVLPQGSHLLTAAYSGDANFLGSITPSAVPVNTGAPDFSFMLKSSSVTVLPGSSASVTAEIVPVGGLTAPLSLQCAGLPANTTCSLGGGSASVGQQPVSANIVITAAVSQASRQLLPTPGRGRGLGQIALACTLGGLVFFKRRKLNSGILLLVACAGLSVSASLLTGCGANASRAVAPPGTYTVQVQLTAVSGTTSITHSQPLTLTIP